MAPWIRKYYPVLNLGGVINNFQNIWQQAEALRELATALAQTQQWAEAREVINSIQNTSQQADALRELATALVQAQQWAEAREVINSIQNTWQQAETLRELSDSLAGANEYKQLLHLIQWAWLNTETRIDAIRLLPLVTGILVYQLSLSMAFSKSFIWVDQFLGGGSSNT